MQRHGRAELKKGEERNKQLRNMIQFDAYEKDGEVPN